MLSFDCVRWKNTKFSLKVRCLFPHFHMFVLNWTLLYGRLGQLHQASLWKVKRATIQPLRPFNWCCKSFENVVRSWVCWTDRYRQTSAISNYPPVNMPFLQLSLPFRHSNPGICRTRAKRRDLRQYICMCWAAPQQMKILSTNWRLRGGAYLLIDRLACSQSLESSQTRFHILNKFLLIPISCSDRGGRATIVITAAIWFLMWFVAVHCLSRRCWSCLGELN